MPVIRVIKKSSRNILVQSGNNPARKSKKSNKKNNKKRKASRKSKLLYGGSEHINKPSPGIRARMNFRTKKLLKTQTHAQMQAQTLAQMQAQHPVESRSSILNVIDKLRKVIRK